MELIVFVKSESSVCCVRIIQISVVIIKCLREGKPRVPGERMREEAIQRLKRRKGKKRKTTEKVSFLFFTFFNFL